MLLQAGQPHASHAWLHTARRTKASQARQGKARRGKVKETGKPGRAHPLHHVCHKSVGQLRGARLVAQLGQRPQNDLAGGGEQAWQNPLNHSPGLPQVSTIQHAKHDVGRVNTEEPQAPACTKTIPWSRCTVQQLAATPPVRSADLILMFSWTVQISRHNNINQCSPPHRRCAARRQTPATF